MPDEAGYPTEWELQRVSEWPWGDYVGLCDFLRVGVWKYADMGAFTVEDAEDEFAHTPIKRLFLDTGGWSGNESIIAAMESNMLLGATSWVQSRRGGHYVYEFTENAWHEPDGKTVAPPTREAKQ